MIVVAFFTSIDQQEGTARTAQMSSAPALGLARAYTPQRMRIESTINALGTERTRAKIACSRVGGRIRSLTMKTKEANRTTGATAIARTFAGLPKLQHPMCVQRPRK
jgi:hypothetical protein